MITAARLRAYGGTVEEVEERDEEMSANDAAVEGEGFMSIGNIASTKNKRKCLDTWATMRLKKSMVFAGFSGCSKEDRLRQEKLDLENKRIQDERDWQLKLRDLTKYDEQTQEG